MRAVRVAGVALLAAAGVLALLLAHDLRSWQATFAANRLQFAANLLYAPRETAPTVLPSSLSAGVLGVGRDRQWLHAVRAFTIAYLATKQVDSLGPATNRVLDLGEAALGPVTQDPDPARASTAYDLLAVLLFRAAYPGDGVDPGLVESALTDLQNAVRVDPANETAKENLELALRVLTSTHAVAQKAAGGGTHTAPVRKGGYAAPPGEGY